MVILYLYTDRVWGAGPPSQSPRYSPESRQTRRFGVLGCFDGFLKFLLEQVHWARPPEVFHYPLPAPHLPFPAKVKETEISLDSCVV